MATARRWPMGRGPRRRRGIIDRCGACRNMITGVLLCMLRPKKDRCNHCSAPIEHHRSWCCVSCHPATITRGEDFASLPTFCVLPIACLSFGGVCAGRSYARTAALVARAVCMSGLRQILFEWVPFPVGDRGAECGGGVIMAIGGGRSRRTCAPKRKPLVVFGLLDLPLNSGHARAKLAAPKVAGWWTLTQQVCLEMSRLFEVHERGFGGRTKGVTIVVPCARTCRMNLHGDVPSVLDSISAHHLQPVVYLRQFQS